MNAVGPGRPATTTSSNASCPRRYQATKKSGDGADDGASNDGLWLYGLCPLAALEPVQPHPDCKSRQQCPFIIWQSEFPSSCVESTTRLGSQVETPATLMAIIHPHSRPQVYQTARRLVGLFWVWGTRGKQIWGKENLLPTAFTSPRPATEHMQGLTRRPLSRNALVMANACGNFEGGISRGAFSKSPLLTTYLLLGGQSS